MSDPPLPSASPPARRGESFAKVSLQRMGGRRALTAWSLTIDRIPLAGRPRSPQFTPVPSPRRRCGLVLVGCGGDARMTMSGGRLRRPSSRRGLRLSSKPLHSSHKRADEQDGQPTHDPQRPVEISWAVHSGSACSRMEAMSALKRATTSAGGFVSPSGVGT